MMALCPARPAKLNAAAPRRAPLRRAAVSRVSASTAVSTKNIVETAKEAGSFKTLVAALAATGA